MVDKGILIKNVYYMLSYAFNELKVNDYVDISGEDFEDIYDLFAAILSKGISFQLKHGLHREYIEMEEDLFTLHGKLNLNNTLRNFAAQRHRLNCSFDELSENNLFNQILKSTMCLLVSHPSVKHERKAGLRKLLLFFDGVDAIDLKSIVWKRLRLDRNSKTYQLLLYLCYFVINEQLVTPDSGNLSMRSFSDENMNLLFQRFVMNYYRKHHPELKVTAKQISWDIEQSQSSVEILPIMQTDIMLTIGERTLIIDTKYYARTLQRHFEKNSIHSGNLYQIFTYVHSLDRHHEGNVDGMLLYAKTEETIVADGQMAQPDGNRIFFRTLDLNQKFDKIKSQLDELVAID